MSRLFDERERTAENIFVHDEEMRFLATRRAVEALGAWAAEGMSLRGDDVRNYQDDLVEALVSGAHEDQIVNRVRTDLERVGKGALSTVAGTTLAREIAAALHDQRVGHDEPAAPKDTLSQWPERQSEKASASWGWPVIGGRR